MAKVRKAIITAAGYGTRFLPATKNIPKELLPIINKPTISYVVDQCIAAGITDIIIVTRFGNSAVEDYFDSSPALEAYLVAKGKFDLAEEIKNVYRGANFIFVRQNPDLPYGNAAPLYSAKDLVGDEPFIYSWGDDIILGDGAGVAEVTKLFESVGCEMVLNCIDATKEEISRIGADVRLMDDTGMQVREIVEKPPLEEVEGNLLSVSPYLFSPEIFKFLDPQRDDKTGEFMIQKAIDGMIKAGADVRANVCKGKWLTNGDPLNYLKSTVEIALAREDLKDDFLQFLKTRIAKTG